MLIDEALREMEDCRKQFGMVWVGELCNYTVPYQYTIKEFEQLVDQAVKLNMVLDVHTELEEMEYIIGKFPQATIVFPHFGDDHEYEHIFKRIDAVAKHPNTYLDTSGYGHDRVGMLEYAVKTIGPDRVLFGSDFSINDPATVIARIDHAALTPEDSGRRFWRGTWKPYCGRSRLQGPEPAGDFGAVRRVGGEFEIFLEVAARRNQHLQAGANQSPLPVILSRSRVGLDQQVENVEQFARLFPHDVRRPQVVQHAQDDLAFGCVGEERVGMRDGNAGSTAREFDTVGFIKSPPAVEGVDERGELAVVVLEDEMARQSHAV